MKYGCTLLIFLLVVGAAQAQYSTTNKKAIKLFELGMKAPDAERDREMPRPNFEAGIGYLCKALDKDPNFIEAHLMIGEFYENILQYDKAIEHYQKALAKNHQKHYQK